MLLFFNCSKRIGTRITFNQFMEFKSSSWNTVFDMRKIHRLGKRNKKFHYRILSDGVSVSLIYEVEKKEDLQPIDKNNIIQRLENNEFDYVLGGDPGMNKWNTTVRRTIATGKEVSILFIHFIECR